MREFSPAPSSDVHISAIAGDDGSGSREFLHGATRKILFLALMSACVFFVPYLVPVKPSVSMSYLMGFSNRAAVVLFAGGSLLFAALTRGRVGPWATEDRKLGRAHLFAALAVACGGCFLSMFPFSTLPHGGEAPYAINRFLLLLAGKRPYLDFEFAYGPAHLYVPWLFAKVFHLSGLPAFYMWWVLQWLLGTAMIWYSIRHLNLPIQRRTLLFWALFLLSFQALFLEGTAYTPVRGVGSAFVVIWVYRVWHRWRRPGLAVLSGLLAILFGLLISAELGIGVAAGLVFWYALLTISHPASFPRITFAGFLGATALIFIVSNRLGLFDTMKEFAGGAYCYPLLPTLPVALLLCAYVLAACVAAKDMFRHNYESMTIPLVAAGFAMLPAAMGRVDLGRLQIAAPAFLLGVGTIEALPKFRRWWRPLVLYTVLLPLGILNPIKLLREQVQRIRHFHPLLDGKGGFTACPFGYRAPSILPPLTASTTESCLDTGYYLGPINAFTPEAIQRKITELDREPRKPVLIPDLPIPSQIRPMETDTAALNRQGTSLFHPKIKREPVLYDPIFQYIHDNYVPDPNPILEPDGWNFRVWRPKPASGTVSP